MIHEQLWLAICEGISVLPWEYRYQVPLEVPGYAYGEAVYLRCEIKVKHL